MSINSLLPSALTRGIAGAWVPARRKTGMVVEDLSPFRNHGTLANMTPATDWITQDGILALDFDNSDDYISLGDLPHFSSAGDATVLCFLRTNAQATGTVNSYFASYNTGSPYQGFGLDCGGNAISTGQAIWDGGAWRDSSASTTAAGSWQLVGASMRGTACTFWANGRAAGTATLGTRGSWTGGKAIGPAPPPFSTTFTTTLFNGQIAFLLLWQKCLEAPEVAAVYRHTKQEFWKRTRKTPAVRGASVTTYTATAALTVGGAEFSASGTFTKPTYTGSASLTVGNAEVAASAEFDQPTYTGSASLTTGGVELSASAEFDAPVFTGSAALTVGGVEVTASGTTDEPTFTASAALTVGNVEVAASGTFVKPTYTGSASLVVGGAEFAASGVTTNTFTASGSLVVGGVEFAASGTFTKPTYTASGSFTTGNAEVVASGTFATNTYTATASLVTGNAELAASGTFTKPTYTASAALICGGVEFAGLSSESGSRAFYVYYTMMMGV